MRGATGMPVEEQRHLPEAVGLWSRRAVRLQMVFLLMLAFVLFSLMQSNLGMALMCMIPRQQQQQRGGASPFLQNTALQVRWTAQQVSLMHTCFYAGTFLCTFVAQNWAQRFGAKAVISAALVVNVLCTWAIPLAALWCPHFAPVALLRLAMGMGQGFFIPCASLLLAKWFPESEKSTAMAIFTTGNQLGVATAMFSTAELCKVRLLGGWPTSFFLYGILGALFLLFWHPLAVNRPRESTRIGIEELTHIDGIVQRQRAPTIVRTPYAQLLSSPAVLSICLCSFAQSFVFVSMISYLPEFYRSVLGLDLTSNGIWSALPFLVQLFSKIALLSLVNFARDQRWLSINLVTKLSNLLASLGCALCMITVSFVTGPLAMLAFLCAAFGLLSGYVPGYNTSIVCVAPAYTAAVSAYGQAWAHIASVLAPIIIGQLTKESDESAWPTVFQLLAAILLFTGIFFQFFGSVNVQSWATLSKTGGVDIKLKDVENGRLHLQRNKRKRKQKDIVE